MSAKDECSCNTAPKLIFSCSGAADVGAVADQAARLLTRQGKGRMYCLAGIGGDVPGIIESTKSASKILAIDGCPIDCARKTLEGAGFAAFEHLRLSDLGMKKGSTPIDEDVVSKAAIAGQEKLGGEDEKAGSCCS
jgi:uncharacterized metal-binding protein